MPPLSPELNLLFGLTALQNGLIDQARLVAGFQAWTRDKDRPLAEHLIALNFLDADQRGVIEAMAALHLKKHGDDPEKSLGAIPVGRSTVEALAAVGDPDIEATLSRRVGEPTPTDPSDQTATYSVGTSTSDGLRFRVLRPHARGGLGAVFVALDGELNREVALKQILDPYADNPTSRHRFVVEAEITGGLEHPGIVPVYGLGAQNNGRPYYAMRFIRGDNLKQAIEGFHTVGSAIADQSIPVGSTIPAQSERSTKRNASKRSAIADPTKSLLFRNLLRRFTDVCNAIDYAHSRGVLHRDIKPGNVIVGKYGETLVVDWGLAKPVGRADPHSVERTLMPSSSSGGAETLPGSALGTPAYMSPEQAAGDLDRLGPRSDVYSLGATLYCLLTGRAPFSGEVEEILANVQKGEFPPPRSLDPAIDPALEAICLKAMARTPGGRYESARALAEDVDRWLADEAVLAYAEPFTRRARRWAKRNRTPVTGAAVALLTGVIGLGAVAAVQTRGKAALAVKNNELTAANAALDLQRTRAGDREARAIDAVKRFRDAVAENPELKDNPSLEPLRKTLLKEPLAFFKSLRASLQSDRDTRPESLARLAGASFELGHLTREIGDERDALIAYEEALAIRQKLANDHPAVTEYQSDLAASHNNLGNLLSDTGQPEAARRSHEAALAIQKKLADNHPDVTLYQSRLARSHNDLAVLLPPEAGRRANEAALAIRRKLADDYPTVTEYQSDLAASHNNLGNLLRATGQPEAARRAYEAALAIRRKLADDHPTVTEYQSNLAVSHINLGTLLSATGQPEAARRSHEAALAIQKKLADNHPDVTLYQSRLAGSHNALGLLLHATGQPEAARPSYEAALAIQQKLADNHPTVTDYQSRLASSHLNLGTLLSVTGQPEAARPSYEAALAIEERLVREHPESSDHASELGALLHNLARLDLFSERFESARDRIKEAIGWQKKALTANPRNPKYRHFLANHLKLVILKAPSLGLDDEADAAKRELAELQAGDPGFAALDATLAAVLAGAAPKENAERLALAQRAYDTARHAAAARLLAEALEIDPALGGNRQNPHRYDAACNAALAASGQDRDDPDPDDALRTKLRSQALDWLREELAEWDRVFASGPPQARPRIAQVLAHWRVDADLAGVREAKALGSLPEAERAAWGDLWARVDALLAKAKGDAPAGELPTDPFAR